MRDKVFKGGFLTIDVYENKASKSWSEPTPTDPVPA